MAFKMNYSKGGFPFKKDDEYTPQSVVPKEEIIPQSVNTKSNNDEKVTSSNDSKSLEDGNPPSRKSTTLRNIIEGGLPNIYTLGTDELGETPVWNDDMLFGDISYTKYTPSGKKKST